MTDAPYYSPKTPVLRELLSIYPPASFVMKNTRIVASLMNWGRPQARTDRKFSKLVLCVKLLSLWHGLPYNLWMNQLDNVYNVILEINTPHPLLICENKNV